MPMIATSIPTAATTNIGASVLCGHSSNDVVEIGLLLPTNWANTLIELSKQRHQSVAQVNPTVELIVRIGIALGATVEINLDARHCNIAEGLVFYPLLCASTNSRIDSSNSFLSASDESTT